jgi:hypothetical protein
MFIARGKRLRWRLQQVTGVTEDRRLVWPEVTEQVALVALCRQSINLAFFSPK